MIQENAGGTVELVLGLSKEQRDTLLEGVTVREVKPGEVLIREGESGEDMYLITEGVMRVVTNFGTATAVNIALRSQGDLLGEINFIGRGLRSATVVAVDEVTVLEFDKQVLLAKMAADLEFGLQLVWNIGKILSERLRGATVRLWDAESTRDLATLALARARAKHGI